MKLTFLHLSDLHYRTGWAEENGLVCDKFFEDLSQQIKKYIDVKLIFSGDLVHGGGDISLFNAFGADFSAKLDALGVTKDHRICVPGNHDVSRIALEPLLFIQQGVMSAITDENAFNNNFTQFSKTVLDAKFANYKNYESTFAKYTCCQGGLGGAGWELASGVSVYCLNTALCSFSGLSDSAGNKINDKELLMIDTRALYTWLAADKSTTRILVMHHPLEWLAPWAKLELTNIINGSFDYVLNGHIHENVAEYRSRQGSDVLAVTAPALFTRKKDTLGYAFIVVDCDTGQVEINYRQWVKSGKFVAGTALSETDNGVITLSRRLGESDLGRNEVLRGKSTSILDILQEEFDRASTCYSSRRKVWVNRDLAGIPETQSTKGGAPLFDQNHLVDNLRSCMIRAPKQFGLTCLGRFMALSYCRKTNSSKILVMIDVAEAPNHEEGIHDLFKARLKELGVDKRDVAGVVIDNWLADKKGRRTIALLEKEMPGVVLIVLHGVDDCAQIAELIELGDEKCSTKFDQIYLWSLSRVRIRQIVGDYIKDVITLDEELVTKKVVADIDSLNIYRTPLNCLLLLKLAEQAFDDSPVNRTEMIGRVLYLLFYQFNKIPTYATRPDLKDCEYALGFFCESLMRERRGVFTRKEFYKKVEDYCTKRLFDLDVEVLFSFLVSENIILRKGLDFEFRFNYWLYFFAAHRMHHDAEFARFILSDHRYSAYPEILEFYAGIDRRRDDAVRQVTSDLNQMNQGFIKKTGLSVGFNPLRDALWAPTEEAVDHLRKEVEDGLATSAVPAVVKDTLADKSYDRSRPYNQQLAKYIEESNLAQMMQAIRGASRALRNSDHVAPEAKAALLKEVIDCWVRICQILVMLSPALAHSKNASFEGMNFYLDETFDGLEDAEKRWRAVMGAVIPNVVSWYQDDIFSKKMGPLLINYVKTSSGTLGELLILEVLIKQRPAGWCEEVERFIVREDKNAYYLLRAFCTLRSEFQYATVNEKTRQELRRLAAMAVAKHHKGVKRPNNALIEVAAQAVLDEKSDEPKKNPVVGKSKYWR